jgi:hypothetical protein
VSTRPPSSSWMRPEKKLTTCGPCGQKSETQLWLRWIPSAPPAWRASQVVIRRYNEQCSSYWISWMALRQFLMVPG